MIKEKLHFSEKDIFDLKNFIDSIKQMLTKLKNENLPLERRLNLTKKFIGVLGEAIGLIKLNEKL